MNACDINPNTIGHIDEETKRVAVLAIDFAKSELNGVESAYFYKENNFDMECWFLVDGVDFHVNGEGVDIWFENGWCKPAKNDQVIYVAEKHALFFK